MNRQSGFTLIELIIVIVILGILAVTAAPQFFNFGSDARASTVRGLEGSIKTASELVHARALMGQVDENGVRAPDGGYVRIRESGELVKLALNSTYAEASEEGIWNALNLSEGDWVPIENAAAAPTSIAIYPEGISEGTQCRVIYAYTPPVSVSPGSTSPNIISEVEAC